MLHVHSNETIIEEEWAVMHKASTHCLFSGAIVIEGELVDDFEKI